jgi:cell division septation protein DedD
MSFGADRTLSATEWRVLLVAACGVLIVGLALGILVGRITAPAPEAPPASASILPDLPPVVETTASASDQDDAPSPLPQPASAPAPVPAQAAPVLPRVVAAPPPAERKPAPAVAAPPAEAKPVRKPAVKSAPAKSTSAKSTSAKSTSKAEAKSIREKAVSEPPPAHGPRWVVQLGAFQSADHADLLVNTLAAHGQPAKVRFTKNGAGQAWFYVQTPPYRSVAAAKTAAQTLSAREHLPTYLIKLPPETVANR